MDSNLKVCSKCATEKSLKDFYKASHSSSTSDDVRPQCKACMNTTHKIYAEEHQESIAERQKQYYDENRDLIKSRSQEWYNNNTERVKENHRVRRVELSEYQKAYAKTEKGRASFANSTAKRRASLKNSDITTEWLANERSQSLVCPACSVTFTSDSHLDDTHRNLDHITPLAINGRHVMSNVRYICRKCNLTRPKDGSDMKTTVTDSSPLNKINTHAITTWDAMFRGARKYVEDNGFIAVHNMPLLVGVTGSCEDFNSIFEVEQAESFFGKKAFLAQSDQLYLEAITQDLEKVYCEIQSFRKEKQVDNRRLCQFSLFEIEHLGDLDELMGHIEGVVKSIIGYTLDVSPMTKEHHANLVKWHSEPFSKVTYTNAVELISDQFPDFEWGHDLEADHEHAILRIFGGPVFCTHYPTPQKFWNMEDSSEVAGVVNSCDLLLPFSGESAGAAARETSYERLKEKLVVSDMYKILTSQGIKDEDFAWYLDAHKDTDVKPHSGAGIGMARVAQFILGVDDIRDAVPFVINSENLL